MKALVSKCFQHLENIFDMSRGPFTNDVATLNNQWLLKKLTKADEEGPRVIRKDDE